MHLSILFFHLFNLCILFLTYFPLFVYFTEALHSYCHITLNVLTLNDIDAKVKCWFVW